MPVALPYCALVDKEAHIPRKARIRRKGLLAAITGMALMAGLGWASNPIGVTVRADEISLPVNLCTVISREVLATLVPNSQVATPSGRGRSGAGPTSAAACTVAARADAKRDQPDARLSVVVTRYHGKDPIGQATEAYRYDLRASGREPGFRQLGGVGDQAYVTAGESVGKAAAPPQSVLVARSGGDTVTVDYRAEPAAQQLTDRAVVALTRLVLFKVAVRP